MLLSHGLVWLLVATQHRTTLAVVTANWDEFANNEKKREEETLPDAQQKNCWIEIKVIGKIYDVRVCMDLM